MSSNQNGITKASLERLNFRVEPELKAKLEKLAAAEGFKSVSAYMRHRLFRMPDEKVTARQIDDVEQKTVATINRLSRDMNQLRIQVLATYCLVDGLAKVILTCLPEASPQMAEQATANAKRRYERLNRAVAQAMRGEGAAVLKELGKYVGE